MSDQNFEQILHNDLIQAIKTGDKVGVSTIRMLLAEGKNKAIELKQALQKETWMQVLQKELKKRQEAAQIYIANQRQELAKSELLQAELIQKYLPKSLSDVELVKLIKDVIDHLESKNFGLIMKTCLQKASGQVDGKKLADKVKSVMQQMGLH